MEVDWIFIKEKLDNKTLTLPKIQSEDQVVDILSKASSKKVFSNLLSKLGMYDTYAPTLGGMLRFGFKIKDIFRLWYVREISLIQIPFFQGLISHHSLISIVFSFEVWYQKRDLKRINNFYKSIKTFIIMPPMCTHIFFFSLLIVW